MREILFRGKRTDNKEWIYGYYFFEDTNVFANFVGCHYVHPCGQNQAISVVAQTICQFSGLTDKSGKKIFEGDIIKNEYEENKYQYFKVFYNEKKLQWEVMNKYGMRGILANVIGKMEIIGNIFDNPNLF